MGRVVCLDCLSGISGDMFTAAFVHSGLITAQELEEALSALRLGLVQVKTARVTRLSLSATHIRFVAPDAPAHLGYEETMRVVKASSLPAWIKDWVLRAWRAIGEAEASVHGGNLSQVHLHEMGDIDTLLDLTCAAAIAHRLKDATFYLPRLVVGMGLVRTHHGVLPVPAPATVELLKGIRYTAGEVEAELATPTGAAILRTLEPRCAWPEATWSAIGYGAGARELPQPNVLRVLIGQAAEEMESDQVVLILADLDDMSPEHFPYAQERLLEAGALDVSGESIFMKKGRPGLRIQVMAPPHLVDTLAEVIFRETTTLGVRLLPLSRRVLRRETRSVETPYGAIRVKLGFLGGRVVNAAPEYEDCRKAARSSGVPLKAVYQAALAAAIQVMES